MSTPLKEWRVAAQISAEEAARQARVSVPTWSRWETGMRRVPAERLNDVVRVTGLAPETIRPDLAGVFAGSKEDAA
jgi:transcriptional regulator with XRE-family HTH domain